VYVADRNNNKIRKIDSFGVVSTFVDSTAGKPAGVAVDSSGNVYVADPDNDKIRKITKEGQVTTLAGSDTYGSTDGTGTTARFLNPTGVAVDSSGNVYVADRNNNKIRKIDSSGVVSTLAGSGYSGNNDGISSVFALSSVTGLTMDSSETIYAISGRKIVKAARGFTASILAGSDTSGSVDGDGTAARFYSPKGIAIDSVGNLYVTDSTKVRKVTPSGTVTTFASGFSSLCGIAVDASGTVYVADDGARKILKVSATGSVSTLAGSGIYGSTDGTSSKASFNIPRGVAVDGAGNVYVTDDDCIRKIDVSGTVITFAGSISTGSEDGVGTAASFTNPNGIIVDSSGNIFVQDYYGESLRMITPGGTVSTICKYIVSDSYRYYPSTLFLSSSGILYAVDTGDGTIYQLKTRRNQ
jgi:sugar lactone lactonase YvrE